MDCAMGVRRKKGESNMAIVDLAHMGAGHQGKVVEVHGGYGMKTRLDAMGIRPGVEITKISSQIMHGPVLVRVGNTQVALGHGMATRVFVETI